ncbi:unnamed protein product [Camellia sinensis]
MLRNSVSFSSKVLTSSNPNSKSTFLFPGISTTYYGIERSLSHSQFYSTTATSPSSSSPDSLKLGFPKLDPVRSSGFTSSAAAIDASPLAAASVSRARDVVDLARHYGRCYWELSKARLSMLVVATSGTGYVLGSGNAIDYVGLCCTCAGTMMVAASANSLNQVFEINNDAKMKRTRQRPLPSGRITVPHAVSWASSVGAAGTALLACEANMLAAGLAASNLFLYAFVYTPLKQIHPVNTWVGAVVGAIPPLLGWVAASGQVTLNGMILPAALYFWQIPHFMALAYLCRDDYAAGGFRMFSLADASGRRTALVALRNCLYLIPLGYLAYDYWAIKDAGTMSAMRQFFRKYTNSSAVFYLQCYSNRRGEFVELSKWVAGIRTSNIIIPAGVNRQGWKDVAWLLETILFGTRQNNRVRGDEGKKVGKETRHVAMAKDLRNDVQPNGANKEADTEEMSQQMKTGANKGWSYAKVLKLPSSGGITSGWFCLESTLLAFAISGTALSFYLNRTTKNARRMFHASLLYLPVFMSGMLLHRLPDNQQLLGEENSEGITIQLSSSETLVQEIEIANCEKKAKHSGVCAQAQPPVAYASVAPFPFLPAPTYAMP